MVGAVVDSGTCVLVALLATRHFGGMAGWAAGLLLAIYGPSIFFAAELAPVPFTLFLLMLAILWMDARGGWRTFAAAGLALGLATGTRPNLLLAGLLALAVPWALGLAHGRRLAGAIAVGLMVGIAPIAYMNLAASGHFTLLTLSGGHNLYIGHNPAAQAQYALPAALDGDIFENMKSLAEELEGRDVEPEEVSGYYTRKAVSHALSNPIDEARLAGTRALLLANEFEATTYANMDYHRWYSPILRWTPTFAWLLALAVPGFFLAWGRKRYHLWIPLLVASLSVLAFFYIARLRIVMVPSLAVFAGGTAGQVIFLARAGRWRPVAAVGAFALLGFGVAKLPLLASDTSNDWNKAGGVLRVMERFEEAEAALMRAREANPQNRNTYLNLAALFRQMGRPEEAAAAEAAVRELAAAAGRERVDFVEALRESGS
jgi:tetratricopeptide (TPR) repeat protein